ncbi:MAG TPA: hypothetical protein VF519_00020 [Mycobacteriales bacterium]|jgi:hypothetical protein
MKRSLNLHREELAELTATELGEVGGGYQITQWCNTLQYCHIPTIPLYGCLPPPE